jgi:tRNA-Thr(GGU) m(6)t(6)A37 methyltransferase TsaA
MSEAAPTSLALHPIGFIRTGKHVKFQALHQPSEQLAERNVLELLPGHNYEQALQDLAGFSRIWLVWWFHRTTTWRTQVFPPRGPEEARGVFATRSPHRPNPLGLTPVQLLGIEGRTLILGECDLVDGTPIFDLKPYVPAYDSFPQERAGWIEEVDALMRQPPAFTVQLSPLAAAQAEWLRTHWQIDFQPRLHELLARDPSPHRTRRIKHRTATLLEIGCGAWRAFFAVEGHTVTVTALDAGFPERFLTDPERAGLPDAAAQLAFLALWPTTQPAAS